MTRPRPRSPAAAKGAAKGTPRGKPAQRADAAPTSLLGRAFKRPGVTIAGAVFTALMTGIVANAMFLQKGHHPAPLFKPIASNAPEPRVIPPQPPARAELAPTPAPVEAPSPLPPPAPAPVQAALPAPVTPPVERASPAHGPLSSKPTAPSHPHKTVAHPHEDSIGDLIGGMGHGTQVSQAVKTAAKTPTKPSGKPATKPAAAIPHLAHADAKARPPLAKEATPIQD